MDNLLSASSAGIFACSDMLECRWSMDDGYVYRVDTLKEFTYLGSRACAIM